MAATWGGVPGTGFVPSPLRIAGLSPLCVSFAAAPGEATIPLPGGWASPGAVLPSCGVAWGRGGEAVTPGAGAIAWGFVPDSVCRSRERAKGVASGTVAHAGRPASGNSMGTEVSTGRAGAGVGSGALYRAGWAWQWARNPSVTLPLISAARQPGVGRKPCARSVFRLRYSCRWYRLLVAMVADTAVQRCVSWCHKSRCHMRRFFSVVLMA